MFGLVYDKSYKEFGLFVSNTSNKVPLVVLKQAGVLTKFVRLKVSISSDKWLSFSPLDPDTHQYLNLLQLKYYHIYLLLDLLFFIILERKPSYHISLLSLWVNIMHHFFLDIKSSMQIVCFDLVSKYSTLLARLYYYYYYTTIVFDLQL